MQFADPKATSIAYLILRHLYDGDVIEWPIPDEHPQRDIFAGLETQGYVARWDRIWPLSDRYRLTEKGIALIESVYRPAGAEAFFEDIRRQNLPPKDRRAYMASRQLDALLWPLLHDPSTHWSTYGTSGSLYQTYLWEDHRPQKRTRPPSTSRGGGGGGGGSGRGISMPRVVHVVEHHRTHVSHPAHASHPAHLVDLDREAGDSVVSPTGPDYDVS